MATKNTTVASTKYVIIDRKERKVLAIAEGVHKAGLLGRLYKAEGHEVVAPPLEGRGLSTFTLEELQYIYWNTTGKVPVNTYGEMLQLLLEALRWVTADTTSLDVLQRKVDSLAPPLLPGSAPLQEKSEEESAPRRRRATDPDGRPHPTSTTGVVWNIADEISTKMGRQAERKEVLEACEKEGINPATASTQFSKWKKFRAEAAEA